MKNIKIIALLGKANCGKSNTLNKLIEHVQSIKEPSTFFEKDHREVVHIQDKKIAITTPGDNIDEILENIKFFKKNDCDMLVTATRTRGETVKKIEKLESEEGIRTIWVGKNICCEQQEFVNALQAKEILNLIKEIIRNS